MIGQKTIQPGWNFNIGCKWNFKSVFFGAAIKNQYNSNNENAGLAWSVTGSPLFTITSAGVLRNLDGSAEGNFTLLVTLKDAGNLSDTVTVNVSYPLRQVFTVVGTEFGCTALGGSTVNFTGTIDVIGNGWEVRVYGSSDANTTFGDTRLSIYDSGSTLVLFTRILTAAGTADYGPWVSLPPGDYTYDLEVISIDGQTCGGFYYQNV